mmetsp:Transcript_22054/g.55278  ORF Transcript_22054/g.55278 Transcript_22054/m.55278 type:complete len:299 (-) Transcript_22054:281-1177(-)
MSHKNNWGLLRRDAGGTARAPRACRHQRVRAWGCSPPWAPKPGACGSVLAPIWEPRARFRGCAERKKGWQQRPPGGWEHAGEGGGGDRDARRAASRSPQGGRRRVAGRLPSAAGALGQRLVPEPVPQHLGARRVPPPRPRLPLPVLGQAVHWGVRIHSRVGEQGLRRLRHWHRPGGPRHRGRPRRGGAERGAAGAGAGRVAQQLRGLDGRVGGAGAARRVHRARVRDDAHHDLRGPVHQHPPPVRQGVGAEDEGGAAPEVRRVGGGGARMHRARHPAPGGEAGARRPGLRRGGGGDER